MECAHMCVCVRGINQRKVGKMTKKGVFLLVVVF